VKVISQREFRNNSPAVMDAVDAGEIYHVTRNGVEIAEVRPVTRRRRLTADELGMSPGSWIRVLTPSAVCWTRPPYRRSPS